MVVSFTKVYFTKVNFVKVDFGVFEPNHSPIL